jgi:aminoglycoside phosphotransferase (APT) family kinase protein
MERHDKGSIHPKPRGRYRERMTSGVAADDVVATHEEAAGNARPPLLVLEPLRAFLDEHGLGEGPIAATPIGDGRSNVTFLLRRGIVEVVLRRPPRPPLPPSAHDVLREARLLRALAPAGVRVPDVLAVGDDEAIIGAPFYVMERLEGSVVTDELPEALDTAQERRRMADGLVDALVEIHAVDPRAPGLDGFGKPTGYLERQLRRWTGLWEHNRTRDLEDFDATGRWLADHLPESPPSTVVHGDYRLGNVMYADEAPARLVGVFDWEMATIGDPLSDVGYLLMTWSEPDDPDYRFELAPVTRREGFPTRDELVALYEERSGRSIPDIRWYVVLALWKATVFMEGNYRRALEGRSDDPYLKGFGDGVAELASRARALSGDTPPARRRPR